MHYLVDRKNRIIDVDERWDADAAIEDASGGSLRSNIIGRQLEDFMVGDATKMFIRTALDAARLLGQTRVLPYRCDSTDQHRRFEMVVSPLDDGQVRVDHRLVDARPRPLRSVLASPPPPSVAGSRCSQCLCVRLTGLSEWLDLSMAPDALLAEDICPACAKRLLGTPPTS